MYILSLYKEKKIQKWGNSFGIRIPATTIKKLNLKENQTLLFNDDEDTITIKKPRHKSLKERMEDFDNVYYCEYLLDIKPIGKELW